MKVDTGRVGPPWWDDRPLAIVGCGPSLYGFDYSRLRGPWYVLAVASALWQLPWADAVYDQDSTWLRVQARRLREWPNRTELYLCWPPSQGRADCPDIPKAIWIEGQRGDGSMPKVPNRIELGFTSGQGALSVAFHKRAREVVLFGFDYGEIGTRQHARDEDYPWHLPPGLLDRQWPIWAHKLSKAKPSLDAAGIRVFNASHNSAIEAFERGTVEEGLARLRAVAYATAG